MRLRKRLIASGLTGSRVRAAAGSAATSPMSSHVSKFAAVNTCFWIMLISYDVGNLRQLGQGRSLVAGRGGEGITML